MQFNKKTPSNSFQPITVSFTVETAEELVELKRLLEWNRSIPALGGIKEFSDEWDIRKNFVDGIRNALES